VLRQPQRPPERVPSKLITRGRDLLMSAHPPSPSPRLIMCVRSPIWGSRFESWNRHSRSPSCYPRGPSRHPRGGGDPGYFPNRLWRIRGKGYVSPLNRHGLDPENSLKRPGFPPAWERRLDSRLRGNDGSRIIVKPLLRRNTRKGLDQGRGFIVSYRAKKRAIARPDRRNEQAPPNRIEGR
jgi:hypothetical protein